MKKSDTYHKIEFWLTNHVFTKDHLLTFLGLFIIYLPLLFVENIEHKTVHLVVEILLIVVGAALIEAGALLRSKRRKNLAEMKKIENRIKDHFEKQTDNN